MSRILLADDSPHAQRMGERILREEGFEVVTVTDGKTAILRLTDVDPDLVFADVSLPGKSGYEICSEIKNRPRHRHVRVVLTAGLLEHFDDAQAVAVRCDAVLKKPFEASIVMDTIQPLLEAAQRERAERVDLPLEPEPVRSEIVSVRVVRGDLSASPPPGIPFDPPQLRIVPPAPKPMPAVVAPSPELSDAEPVDIDVERVRAAVTIALDAAMPAMVDKITEQVLIALGH